jgi:predicted esterase
MPLAVCLGYALGAALVLAPNRLLAQGVSAEIIQLKTRPDVTQQYLSIRETAPVKAVTVLFTGGEAALKFAGTFPNIRWEPDASSYVVRARMHFRDQETAVVIVDAPSDVWRRGQDQHFRSSPDHMEDMRQVVADVKNRFPGARIYLVGTSMGTVSAARVGKTLGKEIDGVVLTSLISVGPMTLGGSDFDSYPVPLLLVHHVNDPCQWTPYRFVKSLADRYPVIEVAGGESAKDNGCGPMGPHGFLGREKEVAYEIKNWIHGRSYRKQIQ